MSQLSENHAQRDYSPSFGGLCHTPKHQLQLGCGGGFWGDFQRREIMSQTYCAYFLAMATGSFGATVQCDWYYYQKGMLFQPVSDEQVDLREREKRVTIASDGGRVWVASLERYLPIACLPGIQVEVGG